MPDCLPTPCLHRHESPSELCARLLLTNHLSLSLPELTLICPLDSQPHYALVQTGCLAYSLVWSLGHSVWPVVYRVCVQLVDTGATISHTALSPLAIKQSLFQVAVKAGVTSKVKLVSFYTGGLP